MQGDEGHIGARLPERAHQVLVGLDGDDLVAQAGERELDVGT